MIGSLGLWPVGPLGVPGSWNPPLGEVDWDQIDQALTVFGPHVVGTVTELTRKRKESLSGLLSEKARLQKKLSKANTSWDRDKYTDQIAIVDGQISALESAISTGAPPSSLDKHLEENTPGASAVPFVLAGVAVIGLGALLVWSLTKKDN